MTATADSTVRDQEFMQYGLVESASENSFADFVSSNLNETEANKANELNEFINTFICHLIFYAVFCMSLLFHILIDLGLGAFVKNQFLRFIEIAKNTFVEKRPAFA